MTKQSDEYEFARKIVKKISKNPDVYSPNRKEAVLNRVNNLDPKAAKEFLKEFSKEYGAN